MALIGDVSAQDSETVARYAAALADYRARRFGEARDAWTAMGDGDGPARTMAARAAEYVRRPPPDDWDATYVMPGK